MNTVPLLLQRARAFVGLRFIAVFAFLAAALPLEAATLSLTTASLPAGVTGKSYSATLAASGGTGTYKWSIASGALPSGLTLSTAGKISGKPTTVGSTAVTVQVKDSANAVSSAAYSVTITAPPLQILYPELNSAQQGSPYSGTLYVTGGVAPYTWSVIAGQLTPGLSLSPAGVLSGTPSQPNPNLTFTAQVIDAVGSSLSYTYSLYIGALPLSITTPAVDPATVGTAYAKTLNAAGGVAPYIWYVISGNLPPGLTLSTAGVISGTPTTAGDYPFQVEAADANSVAAFINYDIYVNGPALQIVTPTIPNGAANTAYSETLQGTGGFTPYTWYASASTLPPGLTLSTAGVLSGTPTTAGSYQIQVELADAHSVAAFQTYAVTIAPAAASNPTPVSITTPSLAAATAGSAYSATLAAAGGTSPYSWSVTSGVTPAGLTLSPAGVLSGTPTTQGATAFTVTVTDASNATASQMYTLVVNAAATSGGSGGTSGGSTLQILYPNLDPIMEGSVYTRTLMATGGTTPYTWAFVSGALPAGVTLNASGSLTGTPTQYGDFQFVLQVTDAASATATANYDLYVDPIAGSGGDTGSGNSGGGGTAPTYQVTVVNGTLNGGPASSGSFAAGSQVTLTANAAPSGETFNSWTGATVASGNSPTTTLTVGTSDITVTANYFTPAPIPQPVTGHPRLWVTAADLPRLQSWASPTNPVYQQGLVPLLNVITSDYQQFFPNGTGKPTDIPNPNYPDFGDVQGYQGLLTEHQALILAFFSLLDTNQTTRIQHATMARNLIMYAFNQAAQGYLANAPFRDPVFMVYNRGSEGGEMWPLIVDWLYSQNDGNGNPILTSSDKATIRTVFLMWANSCLNASTTGGDHPEPIGVMNSTALLPNGSAYRMASNNYYLAHARTMTMMALAFDPVDDPAVNAAQPLAALGNSIRSYLNDATGAWLYQEYAMMGDHDSVVAAYGLSPSASVGLASGGLPPEGMLYGESFAYVLGQMLALKTSGFADPSLIGPQANLVTAPVWDRYVTGYISSLAPSPIVPPTESYLGSVYQMTSYGDLLRLFIEPDGVTPFALLGLLDQKNGVTTRLNAERWFCVNVAQGGASELYQRVQNPGNTYSNINPILYFLLLDPTAPTATDPRSGYANAFVDNPQGRIVEHTSFGADDRIFDFHIQWLAINHQQAFGNAFEFYRKGEWLTKTVSNYDNNFVGQSVTFNNTLGIMNASPSGTPSNLDDIDSAEWNNGSQWLLGEAAGDPTFSSSITTSYTYAYGDATNLYNRPNEWTPSLSAMDVLHASRSILWLKPDYIVVYDRATTGGQDGFKRFNLALTAQPTINGSQVTTTTPGGQSLFITNLLPANASITSNAIASDGLTSIADLEPSTWRITVQDPSNPTDVRFLHVLQGADNGVSASQATLIQSSSGTAFDGASVAGSVVLFKRNVSDLFTAVTFSEPAGTGHTYVTGLSPTTGYSVTVQAANASNVVTVAPGGSVVTDSAGVLSF